MTNEPVPTAQETAPKVPLIHRQILAVMREIEPIPKDATHEHKKFRYRSIDALCNAIHDLLAKHLIYVVPSLIGEPALDKVKSGSGERFHAVMTVQYRFSTTDGSYVDAVVVGEAVDNESACQQAQQFAYKLALQQVFNVASEKTIQRQSLPEDQECSPAHQLVNERSARAPTANVQPEPAQPKPLPHEPPEQLPLDAGAIEFDPDEPPPEPPPQEPVKRRPPKGKPSLWQAIENYMRCSCGWRPGKLSQARIDACWKRLTADTGYTYTTINQADPADAKKWITHYENLLDEAEQALAQAPNKPPDDPPEGKESPFR